MTSPSTSPTSTRCARGSTGSTTSPTSAWPPRCSAPCGCPSRCCSRARPAWARPRRPRRWPRCSTRRWCACSATRASTPPRRSTSGTTPASCSASGWPRPRGRDVAEDDLFGPDYLIERPLLRAIEHPGPRPAVLLVDEVDRADDEFEAFLLELLAEAAVTIPELGTLRATRPAGRGADVEPHPRPARRPQAPLPLPLDRLPRLARAVDDHPPAGAGGVARRWPSRWRRRWPACARSTCRSRPGVAEAIDWVAALALLGLDRLDAAGRRRDAGLRAQVPRGPRPRPRAGLAWVAGGRRDRPGAGVDRWPGRPGRRGGRLRPPAPRRRRAGDARAQRPVRRRPSRWSGPATVDELYWAGRVTLLTDPTRSRRTTGVRPRCSAGIADVADWRGQAPSALARPAARTRRPARPPDPAARRRRATAWPRRRRPGHTRPPATPARPPAGADLLAAASADERLGATDFADAGRPRSSPRSAAPDGRAAAGPPRRGQPRRTVRHPRGRVLDLRATLRRARAHGRRPRAPGVRRRRRRPRRLVLLADVSGSMEPYARAYLHLLHGAVRARPGRGVRVRHPADPADPGAGRRPARRRAAAGDRGGARLVGRHAHRRRARGVPRRLRPPRAWPAARSW